MTALAKKPTAERLGNLQARRDRIGARTAEIDARLAAIADEEMTARLKSAWGDLKEVERDKKLEALAAETETLTAERETIERDLEPLGTVINELASRQAAEALEQTRAACEPLFENERELWAKAASAFLGLETVFDEIVANARELERVRGAVPRDQRGELAGLQPMPTDLRSFVILLAELATNSLARDWHLRTGSLAELVPDKTARLNEAHTFEGVEPYRWVMAAGRAQGGS